MSPITNPAYRADSRSVVLKLEIERVAMLYRQNVPAGFALMLYAFSYLLICGDVMGPRLITPWISAVVISGVARLASSWLWVRTRDRIRNVAELKPWHWFLQSMLFVSGVCWGIAGWLVPSSTTAVQQIFASLLIAFMTTGAIVCWSISRRSMFIVISTAFLPMAVGMLLSKEHVYVLMGTLSLIQLALAAKVGLSLGRYVEDSLKLTIENANLNVNLQREIRVKDQTEEALRLALSSSNAMEWSWDIAHDVFSCKGDLSRSLGIDARFHSSTLAEFLHLLLPEDRLAFQVQTHELAINGGELDTELRLRWSDGKFRDLVFRGKTQLGPDAKVWSITGIAWDTTAQKAQGRVRQERDIHEAANKAKSLFLANASHEIRTPLAAINGYVEALLHHHQQMLDTNSRERDLEFEQTRSDLLAIDRNSKHLISLVNDFLDLSKLDTGRLYIQRSPMSLDEAITESILMVKAQIEAKDLKLEVIEDTPLPEYIESDALRFRQVLVNLLSNAVKFTESGSLQVKIAHEPRADGESTLFIRLNDTGLGMDEVTKSHLFEPFMRGTSEEVQRVSGSGLGLALSRHLARLLGGDLRLVSSALGHGSEFEFSVRSNDVSRAMIPLRSNKESIPNQLADYEILVVDDDEDLRDLMRRFLLRQGAKVDTAANGASATSLASKKSYDVIMMDMKMPVMDGYAATSALRASGYRRPVIALTAYANTDDKQRSIEAGCDSYISKPVDFAFMVATIRALAERAEETDSIERTVSI